MLKTATFPLGPCLRTNILIWRRHFKLPNSRSRRIDRTLVCNVIFAQPISRFGPIRTSKDIFVQFSPPWGTLLLITGFVLLLSLIVLSFLHMASKAWLVFFFVANIVLLYYYFHTMQSALSDEPTCKRPAGRNALPGDWSRTKRSYNQLKLNLGWEKIPRKSSPPPEELHDKWIVLTTVSLPTEDVKKLAKIDGWKVVVVGDTKTPAGWR